MGHFSVLPVYFKLTKDTSPKAVVGFSLRFNEKFGFLRVRHEWNKSISCERGLKKFPPESQVEQEYKTGQRNVLNMVCKGKNIVSN